MTEHTAIQKVDVRNFDMSFGRLVWFMVKVAIAAIPALLILAVIGVIAVRAIGQIGTSFNRLDETTNLGKSNFSSPIVSGEDRSHVPEPLNSDDERKKARQLIDAGKYLEAYSAAHAAMSYAYTDADRQALQKLASEAWERQTKANH